MTPLEKLQTFIRVQKPKPKLNHTKAYGCKAYALIKNRPRLDKLDPKAFIGYLVGYDSTNIYQVWIPSKHKVISTRNVTFDESEKYNPSATELDPLDEVIETIQVPEINKSYDDLSSDEDEYEYTFTDEESTTGSASGNTPSTTMLSNSEGSQAFTPLDDSTHTLEGQTITPRPTPECGNQSDLVTGPVTDPVTDRNTSSQPESPLPHPETTQNNRRGPRTEGIDETNIIRTSRPPKPNPRYDAYLTDLSRTDQSSGFHSAFQRGSQHHRSTQKLHRTTLPALPKHWKDLETHEFGPEFKAAARKEYSNLDRRGTFQRVPVHEATGNFVIPVMWVFTYKFDTDGYLDKFKARLVVRGDLQPIYRTG